jgi:hypothetical protein
VDEVVRKKATCNSEKTVAFIFDAGKQIASIDPGGWKLQMRVKAVIEPRQL